MDDAGDLDAPDGVSYADWEAQQAVNVQIPAWMEAVLRIPGGGICLLIILLPVTLVRLITQQKKICKAALQEQHFSCSETNQKRYLDTRAHAQEMCTAGRHKRKACVLSRESFLVSIPCMLSPEKDEAMQLQ